MESAMTAEELWAIFDSDGYKKDLEELSCYLASIMQERAMVYCLAKHLWKKNGYRFQLEAKRRDLVVNDKHIEFKFAYDFDMERLSNELINRGEMTFSDMWDAARGKSIGWSILLKIYKDVIINKPGIFVWIICSRDLTKVAKNDRQRIVGNALQREYTDRAYLRVADRFLNELKSADCVGKPVRPFKILEKEIETNKEILTNGEFPSTYHFRICDFAPSNVAQGLSPT
jgi:hypothetical protein